MDTKALSPPYPRQEEEDLRSSKSEREREREKEKKKKNLASKWEQKECEKRLFSFLVRVNTAKTKAEQAILTSKMPREVKKFFNNIVEGLF